jgi:hypothetical protein
MLIKDCIRNFLEYIEIEKGRSLKTIDNYARYLGFFEKYLHDKGIKDIKDIKRQTMRDFRMFLNRKKNTGTVKGQDEFIGKKTQNYYLISIRSFLKFLQKNEIEAVSVYGGEELEPPQFGKVAVSVVLEGSNDLSDSRKNEFRRYLIDKTPLTIEPIFVNPEFMYVDIGINAYYSYKQTNKSEAELESLIRTAIIDYNDVNLDAFGATLRTSKLIAAIDNTDDAILSNSLTLKAIIEYSPPLLLPQNPTFKFGSALIKPYPFVNSTGFTDYTPSITSSVFSYNGVCALIQDNGSGIIQIISSDIINTRILNASAGTVDYNTGIVRLVNFTTDGYAGSSIKIFAKKKEDFLEDFKQKKSIWKSFLQMLF